MMWESGVRVGEWKLAEARGPMGLRLELPGPHMCRFRRADFHLHVRRRVGLGCVSMGSSHWDFSLYLSPFGFLKSASRVLPVLVEPEAFGPSLSENPSSDLLT